MDLLKELLAKLTESLKRTITADDEGELDNVAGVPLIEDSAELLSKVMQACNSLDSDTKDAVNAALTYAIAQSKKGAESDFVKSAGTGVMNTLLGQESS